MIRQIRPEILDRLPHDDVEAIASRRDLLRINAAMGNWRWLACMLRRHTRAGDRVLEIGAGRGEFQRWWKRADPACASAVQIRALDLAPRPAGLPEWCTWVQADLLEFDGYGDCDVVLANLVLHHFDATALAALGRRLAHGPRVVLACETARRRLHLWQARLLPMLRVNRVTRHDAPVSVRAGFRGRELPEFLRISPGAWDLDLSTTWRGAYRMTARRRSAEVPA